MTTTRLTRVRPEKLASASGVAVPAFICNGDHFFTEIEVYSDGLFECWGSVDLDFLARKIRDGWISPRVPAGSKVSIHEVMNATVSSCEWTFDAEAFHEHLLNCLAQLNPKRQGLYDFEGEEVELRGKVRYAKVGYMQGAPQRHVDSGENPRGASRPALVLHEGDTYLTMLRVYADGQIDVHPCVGQERLVSLGEFESMVEIGEIAASVPDGTVVHIDSLGRMIVQDTWPFVRQPSDLVIEVSDTIGTLNGEQSLIEVCQAAFGAYLKNPTAAAKDHLKTCYEAIPEHRRMYVGDMDTRDVPVRMALYGDQEQEKWLHRIVARAIGEQDLPTIDVPRPKDEE